MYHNGVVQIRASPNVSGYMIAACLFPSTPLHVLLILYPLFALIGTDHFHSLHFTMGTRGLKVWRYRKRYFSFFNRYDSYSSGLGWSIVKSIPTDPKEYQNWLEKARLNGGRVGSPL